MELVRFVVLYKIMLKISGEINVGDDVTVGAHHGKITFKVKKPDEDKAVELKLNR